MGSFIKPQSEKGRIDDLRRLKLIPCSGLEKVLDVGCEDGFLSQKIKEITGAEVYGVDVSAENCSLASAKGIITKQADLNDKIPFESSFFDLVFAGEVIEHLSNPDVFLEETRRVLKNDGILVLTTPNLSCFYNRILLLLGILPLGMEASAVNARIGSKFTKFLRHQKPAGHLRVFTLGAIKELLKFHDFKIEKIKGNPVTSFPGIISVFERIISLFPSLSFHIMIKARKNEKII